MAAITGYASLKTAVADFLARSDLTPYVDYFIQAWEEDFLREPKNFGRWMEAALNATIASGVIAVPSDYLGLKMAYVDGQRAPPLDRVSLQNLYGRFPRNCDTDLPSHIARSGETFVFGPEPDSAYTIKGVYYAKPTLIRNFASDAAAHWIIVNAPDLAVFGSLLTAEPFLQNDKRIPVWLAMHDRALSSYRNLQRDEDSSGSPLQEVLA